MPYERAGDEAGSDRRRRPESRLDLALERVAGDRGRREGERDQAQPSRVEPVQRLVHLAAQGDQQCGGSAGVEHHLEGLPQLVVELDVLPASNHGTSATWPDDEIGSSSAGP